MAVRLFGDAGAVLGLFASPGLAAQHSGHRTFPHAAGQVVGQLLRHFAALVGNGIHIVLHGHELLPRDVIQAGTDLKVVDQCLFHQGVLDLLPGNGSGIFYQIAQQQPNLGAAGQSAGAYTGSKSIVGGHRSSIPFAFSHSQTTGSLIV